jgi:YD repeat-containing protein
VLEVVLHPIPSRGLWRAPQGNARGIDETLGNGVQTISGFDLANGALDFIQSGPSGSIQNLSYTWDAVGNLTQRQDLRPTQNLTENFFYDNLHRLTSTTGPDPMTVGYDARGSIVSRTGNVSPSEVDGHDAGSGEMNIFVHTDNVQDAFAEIKGLLAARAALNSARVAYREIGKNEYTILWPEHLERFSIA